MLGLLLYALSLSLSLSLSSFAYTEDGVGTSIFLYWGSVYAIDLFLFLWRMLLFDIRPSSHQQLFPCGVLVCVLAATPGSPTWRSRENALPVPSFCWDILMFAGLVLCQNVSILILPGWLKHNFISRWCKYGRRWSAPELETKEAYCKIMLINIIN